MRIWPRWRREEAPAVDASPPPAEMLPEPPEEPTTEQVLEAGPALDWGGDPSRITG